MYLLYTSYTYAAAAAAKSLQSCPTLCDPVDRSPPGSPIPGILWVTLEWVTISFSNAWRWKVKVKSLGRVRLIATPWTAAHQAPPSMELSRQEYWSGLPLSSPGDLPNPEIQQYMAYYNCWGPGSSPDIVDCTWLIFLVTRQDNCIPPMN